MFAIGKTYRHMSCLDIDIIVTKIVPNPGYLELTVLYYNRHYKGLAWDGSDVVQIKNTDQWKWSEISNA